MSNLTPATATDLHRRGVRAIACYCWRNGSYLKLSDSQPITYRIFGGHREIVVDVPPYREYFDKAVWVAVEESE